MQWYSSDPGSHGDWHASCGGAVVEAEGKALLIDMSSSSCLCSLSFRPPPPCIFASDLKEKIYFHLYIFSVSAV